MTNWLEEHLETFVKPHLGSIPDVPETVDCHSREYIYQHPELSPTVLAELKMFWTKGKALSKGKPILFPGRDAWLLHVMANMEGYPTLFHPELSRSVASSGLIDKTQFAGCFIIDCGTNGTIPAELGIKDFALTSYAYYATHPERRLLPIGEDQSPTYGFMMYHAKYWTHAETSKGRDRVVIQTFTERDEFTRCAQLTQHFVEVACKPIHKTMVLMTPEIPR